MLKMVHLDHQDLQVKLNNKVQLKVQLQLFNKLKDQVPKLEIQVEIQEVDQLD